MINANMNDSLEALFDKVALLDDNSLMEQTLPEACRTSTIPIQEEDLEAGSGWGHWGLGP